ncbi:alpha/beta hydrolase [Phaeovulum sp. NW3]|uniref:alpha/beta fold hydrolase n=1 Tax=Phaeovulum sp. NW3 TaxID=2934933 RepID=UPI00201FDCD0|nr:alpha/beta hydrolase [Phaeovulum sp. NW3]MCL7466281.1 alpha/beta fold hydrolase [Phaeovulum sp. NW3]
MNNHASTPQSELRKGFVTVDGKALHYTVTGSGPAVVLLHASPCSSRVMLPLQQEWADDFTCIAFDLPGFGLSEPLDCMPLKTEDLADAIAGGMRALGLQKAALYGRHTGAGVAVEVAHHHPELVTMVLADGFPIFATPYSEERLAEYLPPITPSWEGGHLTWTWYRYREQHLFWPWDRPDAAHRADADMPDPDFLHRGTVELLQAADTYAETYASAFRHAGLKMIGAVRPPVCYGNRPGDSQFKTIKLYPDTAWVHVFPRDPKAAAQEELAILRQHPAPAAPALPLASLQTGRGYLQTAAGPMHLRICGTGAPLIFLPDLPGGIDLHLPEIEALAADHTVYALDPAGNAHSDLPANQSISLSLWVDQLIEAMDVLGLDRAAFQATGTSAALALALQEEAPGRVTDVNLISPPLLDNPVDAAERYAPDISPTEDGSHLLRLWHHLRDQELWFPCFDKRPETIRRTEPRLSPDWLHQQAICLLQQPHLYRSIWQEVLAYPVRQKLQAGAPCSVTEKPEHRFFAPHC